jgi:hypothetical protein
MEMVGTRREREGEMMKAWGRRGTEELMRFGTVSISAQNVCAIVRTGILYPVSPRRLLLFSEKKIQNKTTWPDCPRAVRHLAEWWLTVLTTDETTTSVRYELPLFFRVDVTTLNFEYFEFTLDLSLISEMHYYLVNFGYVATLP